MCVFIFSPRLGAEFVVVGGSLCNCVATIVGKLLFGCGPISQAVRLPASVGRVCLQICGQAGKSMYGTFP
jgi:hypothetical protein